MIHTYMYDITCLVPYKVGSATALNSSRLDFFRFFHLTFLKTTDLLSSTAFTYSFCSSELFLQLGECDRTLHSVLTYPVRQSEICVHLKNVEVSPHEASFQLIFKHHCVISSTTLKPTHINLTNLAVTIFTHAVPIHLNR